jgi:hypothetical protein
MLLATHDLPNDDGITKYLKSRQDENNKATDISHAIKEMETIPDRLWLSLPPSVVGKLLYLLNNLNDDDKKLVEEDKELHNKRVQVGLKLVSTLTTRKAYLIALENYQPLTEYEQVKAEDSVDALWHNTLFSSDDETLNKLINGAYNKLNSEDMVLNTKNMNNMFYKHEYLEFIPVDYAMLRESKPIVDDLKEIEKPNSKPLTQESCSGKTSDWLEGKYDKITSITALGKPTEEEITGFLKHCQETKYVISKDPYYTDRQVVEYCIKNYKGPITKEKRKLSQETNCSGRV